MEIRTRGLILNKLKIVVIFVAIVVALWLSFGMKNPNVAKWNETSTFSISTNAVGGTGSITPFNQSLLNTTRETIDFTYNNDTTNILMYASVNGTRFNFSSMYTKYSNFTENRYKWGYNLTIPNNAQGTLFSSLLQELIFNITSTQDLNMLSPTAVGYGGMAFDFKDIAQMFGTPTIQIAEVRTQGIILTLNDTDGTKSVYNTSQFISSKNALIIFNTNRKNFTIGQSLILDPTAASFGTGYDNNSVILLWGDSGGEGVNSKIAFWNVSAGLWSVKQPTNDTRLTGLKLYPEICVRPNNRQVILTTENGTNFQPSFEIQVINESESAIMEGSNTTFQTNIAGSNSPIQSIAVACAYESNSTKGIVSWIQGSAGAPPNPRNYTTWNGSTWSSPIYMMHNGLSFVQRVIKLVPNPIGNSGEIIFLEQNNNRDISAQVWNSTTWGNVINFSLTSVTFIVRGLAADCAYESISGNAVCFYANSTAGVIDVIKWNGTVWYNVSTPTNSYKVTGNTNSSPIAIIAKANPLSNEISVMYEGADGIKVNFTVLTWNGTNITNQQQIEKGLTARPPDGREIMSDIAYRYFTDNSTSTELLAVYVNGSNRTSYTTWNGVTWNNTGNATETGTSGDSQEQVHLITSINGQIGSVANNSNYWAFLCVKDINNDLNCLNWNSTIWSAVTELETTVASSSDISEDLKWLQIDNSTPVFRSIGTNETNNNITFNGTINLNGSIRDNFHLDCWWIQTNESNSFVNYSVSGNRFNCTTIKGTPFQYANITWTNTSIASYTAIGYYFCANDTMNNKACSDKQQFIINVVPAGDSTAPTITLNIPINVTYTNSSINVNFTATDNALDQCKVELDGFNMSYRFCPNITLTYVHYGSFNASLSKNLSYDFENDTGVIYDKSPNNNNGTLVGRVVYNKTTPARLNYSGYISLSNQIVGYVRTGSNTVVTSLDNIWVSKGTLCVWVNPQALPNASVGYGSIVTKASDVSSNNGWMLQVIDGDGNFNKTFRFVQSGTGGDGVFRFPKLIARYNDWQHICMSYDASSLLNSPTFYYNGTNVTDTNFGLPAIAIDNDTNQFLEIGNNPDGTSQFDGSIDELQIWRRILTDQEIYDIYTEGNFNGTHKVKVWANDTSNNIGQSSLLTFSIGSTGAVANTCTPTNNAQWDLSCADTCVITGLNVNITNWIINNSGTISISNSNISYENQTWNPPASTCNLTTGSTSTITERK